MHNLLIFLLCYRPCQDQALNFGLPSTRQTIHVVLGCRTLSMLVGQEHCYIIRF